MPHPGGRPSDYDPKYCDELLEYFSVDPYFETPVERQLKNGTVVTSIKFIPSDLPTLAGFACKIGVHRDTLNQWSKDHPEFSDAVQKAKEYQEKILVNNALKGLYNPAFSIFFAKNNLGWKDRQDVTSNDGKLESLVIIKDGDQAK